jgi:hypothetical protein
MVTPATIVKTLEKIVKMSFVEGSFTRLKDKKLARLRGYPCQIVFTASSHQYAPQV